VLKCSPSKSRTGRKNLAFLFWLRNIGVEDEGEIMFLQQVVSGLINGSAYSLVAVGIAMIYKATRTLNFAQGEFFMVGAYSAYFLYVILGFNYWISFLFATLAAGVLGLVLEKIACEPLLNSPHISMIVAAIGLSVTLKGGARLLMGPREVPFPSAVSNTPVNVFGLIITPQQMVILGFTFVFLIILSIFFHSTKLGKSMRAVCSNKLASSLMGIPVNRIFSITWGLSAFLGATGGVLLGPVILIYPDMGSILIKAFAAAAIGGFSSLNGSIIGGFLIGLIENVAGGYVSTAFTEVTAFLVLIIVLIFKPTGLFGRKIISRV
jgi:branched-chain amino acid transport system permease protein